VLSGHTSLTTRQPRFSVKNFQNELTYQAVWHIANYSYLRDAISPIHLHDVDTIKKSSTFDWVKNELVKAIRNEEK